MSLEELPEDLQRELCESFTTVRLRGVELMVILGILDLSYQKLGLYESRGPKHEYWRGTTLHELELVGIRGTLRLVKAAIAHKREVVQMESDVLPDPMRRILWLAEELGVTDD
jgi:hypothetical protein